MGLFPRGIVSTFLFDSPLPFCASACLQLDVVSTCLMRQHVAACWQSETGHHFDIDMQAHSVSLKQVIT